MLSYRLGVLVLAVAGLHVTAAAPVQPDTAAKYKHAIVEGENLHVACNVTEDPDVYVYWTKNASSSTLHQNGTRLIINNIQRASSGDYLCHAVNTSDVSDNGTDVNNTHVVEVVTVDVLYPAVFTMRPTHQVAHENDSVYITCYFDANPPARVSMYNNDTGQIIASATVDKGSIQIGSDKAVCKNGGLFICTGYNYLNHGVNSTSMDNVTVLCKPQHDPQAGGKQHLKRARLGDSSVNFEMDYVAYPPPTITWVHEGVTVPASRQITTRNETFVTFPNVRIEDFGNYTVILTNDQGSYMDTYRLEVEVGKPQTPTNLEYYNVTYDGVTLRWTSGFDMGSQQFFIIIDTDTRIQISPRIPDTSHNHGVGQTWTYRVSGLSGDTLYRLSVFSQNYYNYQSDDAVPVQFWTPHNPYSDNSSHSRVGAIVGGSVGGLVLIAVLAFVVYHFKYRNMRTTWGRRSL